jgi:branched-chain amino acid aminotransferase
VEDRKVAQLQKPEFVYMGGKLRPWEEATLHVGCEAVTRGLNVFEGIKGYWQLSGQFAILQLRRHYERLCRSAKLLHIPCKWTYEEYQSAIFELIGELVKSDRDMWARTTLYVIEGHWGEDTMADLVVTAYHQDKQLPQPINVGVSTWRRSADDALPARIKTSTNYQAGRLARIEGRALECQDMILLNQWGRVSEATGSCVLIVREETIYTPPATEGALESITLNVIEALAQSSGIKFVRRPVDKTELLVADEIGLCGTLAELTLVKSIQGQPLAQAPSILRSLQERYMDVARGVVSHPAVELTFLPYRTSARNDL